VNHCREMIGLNTYCKVLVIFLFVLFVIYVQCYEFMILQFIHIYTYIYNLLFIFIY